MSNFLNKMSSIKTIYTHDGTFHCDEILAIALLRCAGCHAPVVRTRIIPSICSSPTALRIDVGMACDFFTSFDHHQPNSPIRTACYNNDDKNTTRFSSAGLLWQTLGKELAEELFPDKSDKQTRFFELIDRDLILPIDCHDNGIETAFPRSSLALP